MRTNLTAILAVLLVLCTIGPAQPQSTRHSHAHHYDGWKTGQPPKHVQPELAALARDLRFGAFPNIHALIVEHDGKLVHEQYLTGEDETIGRPLGKVAFNRHTKHDLRSISKSVTALVLGIALKDDFEAALAKPILSFFPEWQGKTDPKMEAVTLEHALTMTSGIEWNEMDLPYSNNMNDEIRIYAHRDPFKHVLTRPMRKKPGERWYYNGGLTTLLAGVIQKQTGQLFTKFAGRKLFKPIGIKEFAWMGPRYWPPGMGSAASGLRLTARDLARFGSLVLNEGRWQGKQLVPAKWIRLSTRRLREDLGTWGQDGIYGYGYHWWSGRFPSTQGLIEATTAMGHGGQRVFVIPKDKLVVSVFAGNYRSKDWMISERLMTRVVEAFRRNK